MFETNRISFAVKSACLAGAAATLMMTNVAIAQEPNTDDEASKVELISVTGSRVRSPGAESSSPILSIGADEITFLGTPEFENIIRNLPATIPGDNSAVNNGTAGAATVNLRGLGSQRNLVLLNGRRMVPFNFNGQVDTSTIPTALIERIDVVTGGASAVYGSDAIAGAINVILKNNFEGVAFDINHAQSGDSDGDTDNMSLTIGANLDDDRGNAVLSVGWMERDSILLADRPFGLIGINSNTGAGLSEFLAGAPPAAPPAGCGGPGVVDFVNGSGSTTAIPTAFELIGTDVSGQFRDDRSIGDRCSRFNFGPFNYFQTPQERYNVTALANYEINEYANVYGSFNFTNTTVRQQVAPSGTFGASFQLPLYNPLLSASALDYILTGANASVGAGTLVNGGSWIDNNNNGLVDSEDDVTVRLRRRTLELGTRSEQYDSDIWQFVIGSKGTLIGDWAYDASYQYGESNRATVRGGYTNLTNIQSALRTRDGVTCENGDSSCVPIDLFGGFGTITDEMAGYATAIALQTQGYEQTIANLIIDGPIDAIMLPTANSPFAMSAGFEYRKEIGSLEPDECLKLAPASCQGGAGGNLLPIRGGFTVQEFFFEGILPIADDVAFAERIDLELGFRTSDYDSVGTTNSWKVGLNWRPVESLLLRAMQQKANRAPNVGELGSPVTSGLTNAVLDPCSVENVGNITPELTALCVSTGMSAAQVGVIPDIISGQINVFAGSDVTNPPGPEEADTTTAGLVYSPDFGGNIDSFVLSVDYYNIEINDIIGTFSAQEVLDSCYNLGDAQQCAKINRVGGDLTGSAAGVDLFTTNLKYLQAEGIELQISTVINLDDMGSLALSANVNKYLTQESQSSDSVAVLDCVGFVGTSCDPISDLRWVQRTTYMLDDLTVSLQWRHIGGVSVEPVERDLRFEAFRSIDSYNYFDLFASYQVTDYLTVTGGIDNLTDEAPPIVGSDIGDTSSNNGNTFPANYDVLGRMFKAGVSLRF